jgi:type II secretory pathway predicted ATPase ExeA
MFSRGPKGRPFVVTANGWPFRPFGYGGHSSRADGPGYLNGWAFGPNRSNSSNKNASQRCPSGLFFISESIRSILPQLLHALRSDLGIAVLTGPAGVGKTSLLKHLQTQLAHEGRAVLCSGAGLETPAEVLQTLQAASLLRAGEGSSESGSSVAVRSRWTVVEQMRKTTEFWGPILLLVDDAQLLSVPVLNELRAFTEEEWNGRALVRCLIAGPLNLEEELARPAHVDFSRRVRCHAFLEPLSSKESLECLNRHLSVVGGKLRDVFSPQALDLIAVASDGLPRCLTLLADESLVVAGERSTRIADEDCVRTALTRLQHLAYAWNTSPMVSDHQSDLSESAEELPARSTTVAASNAASTVTHIAAGIFEFGAPGVVEFGAKPLNRPAFSQTTFPSVEPVEVAISQLASNHDPALGTSSPVVRQVSSAVFEMGSSPTQSFEVGHRYQPDALEATDAVEMDAFANITAESQPINAARGFRPSN